MSDSAVNPSLEDLRALRVVDLKQILSPLGLSTAGRKEDLVQRLKDHYDSQEVHQVDESEVYQQEAVDENEVYQQEAVDGNEVYQQEAVDENEVYQQEPVEENEVYQQEAVDENEAFQQEPVLEGSNQQLSVEPQKIEQDNWKADEVQNLEDVTPIQKEDVATVPKEDVISVQKEHEAPALKEQASYAEEKEVKEKADDFKQKSPKQVATEKQVSSQEPVAKDDQIQGVRLFKKTIQPPRFASVQPLVPPPAEEFELENLSSHPPGPPPLMSLNIPNPALSNDHRFPYFPKALEDALARNVERSTEIAVGADASRRETNNEKGRLKTSSNLPLVADAEDDEDDDEDLGESRDKNARQKKKKKKKRRNRAEEWARQAAREEEQLDEEQEHQKEEKVDIEYIQEKIEMDYSDPLLRQFAKVFETFRMRRDNDDFKDSHKYDIKEEVKKEDHKEELTKVPKLLEADDLIEEVHSDEGDQPKLSKRKLKKMSRLSVAQLKQLVVRPDVVEMHDVTAKDPALLILLKSTRNSVPVPRHWCFKRKYLQGKRGIEKPPFNLPDFIKKTGIMEMRAALQEKEDSKNLKSKMREKVRPKLGKIDIDYQKLHDAFFKWQTKPKLSSHGDLYYEGKEFEIRLKEKKPGDLSDDLRTALGMPVGPNSYKVPPPWLIAMQRYGPPPSYPNLKISGLNAPIPEGCSFGYHAGGWGKPPVDEAGKPLYGDVFGMSDGAFTHQTAPQEVDQGYWGEVESESSEEESEEEEEEEDEEEKTDVGGLQTPLGDAGLATPSGMSSVGMGLGQETPDIIELRKKKIEADMEGGETPSLYTILNERQNDRIGSSMMGSSHTYEIPPLPSGPPTGGRGITRPPLPVGSVDSGVDIALNPEEVDLMDTDAMAIRAEAALREKQASLAKEDFSDMVAEHAAKQSNKRKRPQAGAKDDKGSKKYKEFKF